MRPHPLLALGLILASTAAIAVACSDTSHPVGPAPVHYTATLNAANERQANPVSSTAAGTAVFTLRGNDSLDFTVMASGLSAAAVASHIHVGAPSASGPIVNGFAISSGVTSGTVASGTIILSQVVAGSGQISGDSLRVLLENGNAYVNVHTSTYPAGEVRGQIVKQ